MSDVVIINFGTVTCQNNLSETKTFIRVFNVALKLEFPKTLKRIEIPNLSIFTLKWNVSETFCNLGWPTVERASLKQLFGFGFG